MNLKFDSHIPITTWVAKFNHFGWRMKFSTIRIREHYYSHFFITAGLVSLLLCIPTLATQRRGLTLDNSISTRRFALVIGNNEYDIAPLRNSVNDATDIAQTLGDLGFDVLYKENISQSEMKRVIRSFGEKIRGGGIGLFYYAGHGLQVKGVNYLVPVNAKLSSEEEIEFECVEVGSVIAQMESAKNDLNILILDACRNNPFASSFRSASRGLAPINAPRDILIAYATGPGSVASDGKGRNGIYTQELLRNIRTPNLSIEQVFKRIRVSVINLTQGKQTPWESSSLTKDFYFVGSNASSAKPKKEVPFSPTVQSDPAPKNRPQAQGQIAKSHFYNFGLEKCAKSGTTIACDLVITNQDKDRDLVFGDYNSSLYDDMGNAGKIKNVSLANQKGMYYAKNLLVSGVPTKARVGFEDISPQATKISLMTIRCFTSDPNSYPPEMFEIKFRNVPLDQ
jgi:hypothetical protein